MAITSAQINNIQIDYGVVYADYGETGAVQLGVVTGGATFAVTATKRDIEYDGAVGPEKGLVVIDDIDAMISFTLKNIGVDELARLMPYAAKSGSGVTATPYVLTVDVDSIGVIAADSYLTNITMIAKTVEGKDVEIKLFNALNRSDVSIAAVAKGEAAIPFEYHAHFTPTDDTKDYFTITYPIPAT